MKVEIKLKNEKFLPVKQTKHAAGLDVVAAKIIKVPGINNKVTVDLGFSISPPNGYKTVLVPRSSITKTGWLLQNSPGQIDPDYTGNLIAKFITYLQEDEQGNVYYEEFPYKEGDRIGQIFLEKIEKIKFKEVTELNKTDRDDGGFGSTGEK